MVTRDPACCLPPSELGRTSVRWHRPRACPPAMVRSNKEVRCTPLWRGPPPALLVSTSPDPFGCSDRQKVAEVCHFPIHTSLTHVQVSGWQSLKGYATYKGHTLSPEFIQRLVKKEGGVSLVLNP